MTFGPLARISPSAAIRIWTPGMGLPTTPSLGRPRGVRVSTGDVSRSEEHTSELQSRLHLVCRLLLEKKKIADFRQDTPAAQKLKKGNGGGEAQVFDAHGGLTLHLVRNQDILGSHPGLSPSSVTSHRQ